MVVSKTNLIKCVVIGDDSVGKTSMLVNYATNRFPTQHVPSVFDNYAGVLCFAGRRYHLQLLDTIEEETLSNFKRNMYPGTDVFVVCFSVVNPESFQNVENKWIPEIKNQMRNIPVILAGTQADLRQSAMISHMLKAKGHRPITPEEGYAMSRRIGASHYIECSPEVEKTFKRNLDKALVSVLRPKGYNDTNACTIL
ncbi:hypothetical protein ScPMuIL_014871 [Solemya velum]